MFFRLFAALTLSALVICSFAASSRAQSATVDTSSYSATPPADSLRVLDSLYQARRAMVAQWASQQRAASHPQDDFLSFAASAGAFMKIRANDLNQYFAERVYRADPKSDRDQFSTLTNAGLFVGQAQLTHNFGIFVEYDYFNRTSNTTIDSNVKGMVGTEEELAFTEHTLSTGVMALVYSTSFYRFRINAGIGGVFVTTDESELAAKRSASAKGYSFNIDLINDFRFDTWGSFTLDFLSRSASTATLKTADGQTLDKPFGKRTTALSIAPNASNLAFGFAAGVVLYF